MNRRSFFSGLLLAAALPVGRWLGKVPAVELLSIKSCMLVDTVSPCFKGLDVGDPTHWKLTDITDEDLYNPHEPLIDYDWSVEGYGMQGFYEAGQRGAMVPSSTGALIPLRGAHFEGCELLIGIDRVYVRGGTVRPTTPSEFEDWIAEGRPLFRQNKFVELPPCEIDRMRSSRRSSITG